MISFSWSAGISVGTSSTSLHHHVCNHIVTVITAIYMTNEACLEYTILEVKLLSTAAVLYLLCCRFAAGSALRFQSISVHLMALVAESLKTSDGSVLTAFVHDVGPHPVPSLQCRPVPAHRPSHEPAWLLLICFPPSHLLLMCIQLSASGKITYDVILFY